MYDRILFPTDGSEIATSLLAYALDVAAAHDATLHVLNVADTTQDSVVRVGGDVRDVLEDEGEEIVGAAAERVNERGVPVVTDVEQGHPAETIVEYARRRDIDLIIVPTHGRSGLERVLLGSVTERVVEAADVPVLTVNPDVEGRPYPTSNVLVPTDGSPEATAALDEGISLASATDATLHVLSVVETERLGIDVRSTVVEEELRTRANEVVADAADAADARGVDVVSAVTSGHAYREILSYVESNDVGLVVVGTQSRTGFDRYLLGSVTSKLVRTSPVPVLLVRGDEPA